MAATAALLVLSLAVVTSASEADIRLADIRHRNLVGPHSVDAPFDCAMRNLSWAYANHLLPSRSPLLDVFDALRLSIDCDMPRPSALAAPKVSFPFYTAPSMRAGSGAPSVFRTLPLPPSAFFVDAKHGSDTSAGSQAAPFKSIDRALRATRGSGVLNIVLRGGGVFYLSAPLVLGAFDSGLVISAFPGEAPVVSGGAALEGLDWVSVGPSSNSQVSATVWSADLSAIAPKVTLPFSLLFGPDGRRAVRARFPDGNPEQGGLVPNGYTLAASWGPPNPPLTPSVQVDPQLGTRPRRVCPEDACTANKGAGWSIFCCFFHGNGWYSENLTSGSYWGVDGGSPGGEASKAAGSMIVGSDLAPRLAGWTNPEAAVVNSFTNTYWGSWHWSVGGVNETSGSIGFSAGGVQARDDDGGQRFFIENIFQELDFPGEWFVDATTSTLFYCANGTAPPPSGGWVAGQLKNIVSLVGTPAAPVVDVALMGLTFEHTESTMLDPFTAPSGGDWFFQDNGAVRFSGTVNCSVSGSLFINLGGTGVMISGRNRLAQVNDSEFLWLGDAAVISAGLSGDRHDNSFSVPDTAYGEGVILSRNLAHEFGVIIKQTGFYYHALTANATIIENVFFNGPRAGININDDFAGGSLIARNLAFNLVRETSDHVSTVGAGGWGQALCAQR